MSSQAVKKRERIAVIFANRKELEKNWRHFSNEKLSPVSLAVNGRKKVIVTKHQEIYFWIEDEDGKFPPSSRARFNKTIRLCE